MSAVLGGLIGCGLFGLMTLVVLLVLGASNAATDARDTQQAPSILATLPATNTLPAGALASTNTPLPPTAIPTPTVTPQPVTLNGELLKGSIVYASERDGNTDLYRLDLDTGVETRLTDDPANELWPAPSPDGDLIAFASDRTGNFEIYLLDLATGEIGQLTNNTVDDLRPSFSPGGTWILYASDTGGDGYTDLYRVHTDGSGGERLFASTERNADPFWSAEDNAVYFTSGTPDDASTWEIRRLDLNTREISWVTENEVRDRSPSSGPGGTLLIETDGDGDSAIGALNPDTGAIGITYDGPGFESSPSLSIDGRYILLTSDVGGADQVFVITVDGGVIQQITRQGGLGAVWLPGT